MTSRLLFWDETQNKNQIEQFSKNVKRGNLIPIRVKLLTSCDTETPVAFLPTNSFTSLVASQILNRL